jgi:hypothetical protein
MAGFSSWLDAHFNLIQTVGIVGTLLFAGIGVHREAKAKEVENLLTLAQHHRELWASFAGKNELKRVLDRDVDLTQQQPTVAEEEFLNLVFVHFLTGWWIAQSGGITKLEEMKLDVRDFFSLPLPHAVWEKTKKHRNRRFVSFVEKAMKRA